MPSTVNKILEQLPHLYAAVVSDILDSLGYRNQALPSYIRPLTNSRQIYGQAFTVHAMEVHEIPSEPYKLEIEAVDSAREGEVLVAEIESPHSCGFWGELLTTACLHKNVHGCLMDGCSRDIWKLKTLNFPVFGIGYHPADSKGRVDIDAIRQPIKIGGVTIRQGDYILGDDDGTVVIPQEIADEVIRLAKEKVTGENTARKALESGESLGHVFRKYGIL